MDVQAAAANAPTDTPLRLVLLFGGLAMLALALLQLVRFPKGGRFTTSFMKAYG